MHWVAHLQTGPRRVNHAAAAVGEMIFTFGGYSTGEMFRYIDKEPIDVHVLHIHHLEWKEIPRPEKGTEQYELAPYQRYGHTAVAYGKNIYLWGGRNDELACNRVFCFDTETFKWSNPRTTGFVPCTRDGHSACVIGNSMYIFGGYEEEFEIYSQDVYALDLEKMNWTFIITQGTPPEFRDFHTGTAIGTRMYIFGGRSDMPGLYDHYPNTIVYLDTVRKTWRRPETHGSIPFGRRSHSAVVYENQLYIFGGYNGITNDHFNDIHRFCPVTNTWSPVTTFGHCPNKRRRQVCIVIYDKMYLFGGTSPIKCQTPVRDSESQLADHNDLHVLDFRPTLRTLCLLYVVNNLLVDCPLPEDVRRDLQEMKERNPPSSTMKPYALCS